MAPSEIPAAGTAENPAVVENKVFDLAENSKALGQAKVTYKNCYFYNACGDGGGYMRNRTFDGCTFVDATTYIFNMGSVFTDRLKRGQSTLSAIHFTA